MVSAWSKRIVLIVLSALVVERLFAGAEPREILDSLPTQSRTMFNESIIDAFDSGGSHWYLDAFAANSLVDVTPRAPVRLYYGSEDVDVVPEEALAAARAMQARGADVTAIDVGAVGHDASMLAAAPLVLAWLRELDVTHAWAMLFFVVAARPAIVGMQPRNFRKRLLEAQKASARRQPRPAPAGCKLVEIPSNLAE